MRTTLTSIIALGFAVTSTTAVLADEHDDDNDEIAVEFGEDQQRFTDAGFEGARVMHNVEVARVTHDDETFYVVHGIDDRMGMQMDRTGVQPGVQPGDQAGQPGQLGDQAGQPGDMQQDDLAADDPLAQDTQPGIDTAEQPGVAQPGTQVGEPAMAEHRSLEELLEQAGIEDYEILDDVSVASTRLGEGIDGQEVYVFYGIEDAEGDS